MKNKKTLRSCLALLLVAVMMLTVAGCKPEEEDKTGVGVHTYNTYTAQSPSNWNELTYKDNNDTQIMSYIGGSFFGYDFKFDANGEILPGEFEVVYTGATKLEDISAEVDEKWGVPADAKGYAYRITLREDLKWDDGTAIKAEDFVYTIEQLLAPEFQNYRADTVYVGGTVLVNAKEYNKQGTTVMNDNSADGKYTIADLVKGDDGVYAQADGRPVKFALDTPLDWCSGKTVAQYSGYMDAEAYAALRELADESGYVDVTDDTIALVTKLIDTDDWGHEPPENVPYYMVYEYAYPELAFSEVGIYAESDYELVIVLAKALPLLKEDGSLSYQAAYNMASLPLVKKDLYESCKVEPADGTTLWTTTYNTSVATTASWGAFKLESFQAGTQYVLVRNENWYGYSLPENEGLYQTDRIVCDTVKEWNSAWTLFQAGKIDDIGIDVTIADDYKGSDRAYFTPDDYVASLQLQSSIDALKAREEDGINKSILGYNDFRRALSLAINRTEFATTTTTSSKAGYGLFNSMHYYDVENGGAYRNSDDAKKVLCDVYGVDVTKYDNLDAAVESITGYNVTLARELLEKAYADALAAGDIKETDVVKLTMGTGTINEVITRRFDYIKNAWLELVKGTSLEGRLEFDDYKDFGDTWADDFIAGSYDVCMGGWTGAAWDPGYFLMAYLHPSVAFSAGWDTFSQMMTFTMKGVGENGADIEETMSLMDWYNCLNGDPSAKYDWSANALEQSQRLQLIAALEKEVLLAGYSVPLYNNFAASLLSYKVDYITYEYNTFMAYGGLKYMTYNFDDAEWAAEVAKNNNVLNYK